MNTCSTAGSWCEETPRKKSARDMAAPVGRKIGVAMVLGAAF
jgi:hypothetical protein